VKLSLFEDDKILYLKDLKNSTRKCSESDKHCHQSCKIKQNKNILKNPQLFYVPNANMLRKK
jgi:hypothetical protein